MRLSGSELVSISLLFLLISVAAAQYQYYDDEDQVGHGHLLISYLWQPLGNREKHVGNIFSNLEY